MNDNGEEKYGAFVVEHDVVQVVPVARHKPVLNEAPDADLLHFIPLEVIRIPGVKMIIDNTTYVTAVPNCFELD